MRTIDWNKASELGLIVRINKEILHPLGLAMSRNPENGFSENILISDDGEWEYAPDIKIEEPLTKEEIQKILNED